MAGQGDNQVFHVVFDTKHRNLRSSLLSFLSALERNTERLNHEVKPEECIDSASVITYGKEIYSEGVHILYSLKFSSRAFARLDLTVPSLSKEVAGCVANSMIVAGCLRNTILAIWWKHVQVLLMLRRRARSPLYSQEKKSIETLLRSKTSRDILLIPGSVGGFQ